MSYPSTQMGARPFNHQQSSGAEAEYDRLRDLARAEHGKYQHCAAESRKAYERGDGAGAHQMSEEGEQHAQKADQYNKQASEYIFRENNAVGKVDSDTIDLHGQYVEEAAEIVEQRIRYAQSTGQDHLHVIVGKGHHSYDHVDKLKPRVEQVCQQLGLQYQVEHNEGRLYVNLKGGPAHPPSTWQQHPTQYEDQQYGKPHYETAYPMGGQAQYGTWSQGYPSQQQAGYPSQNQQQYSNNHSTYGGDGQQQNQQNQQQMEMEQELKKALPVVLRCIKSCCTVM